MDIELSSRDENIRKIEDIIDIQKAKGNFNNRQVAFTLPSETESVVSANLAKSLETGLSHTKPSNKKLKKLRAKRHNFLPDVISWPSDSDITVLRMKLFTNDLKDKVGGIIPGDGLHQPDSSSMVNLATLMFQSQPPSKHSIIEEYLLPLTSWEKEEEKEAHEDNLLDQDSIKFRKDVNVYKAMCSYNDNTYANDGMSSKESGIITKETKKSKFAKFLRLYFCPCCTCLYEMEKMHHKSNVDSSS